MRNMFRHVPTATAPVANNGNGGGYRMQDDEGGTEGQEIGVGVLRAGYLPRWAPLDPILPSTSLHHDAMHGNASEDPGRVA